MKNKNLATLSDQEIDLGLNSLAICEREILSDILLHICEVDRRKMYLRFGYSSLFDYLTQHHKFSNASAQRRIHACRLSYEVPNVIDDLQSGAISLAQVELIQKCAKQAAEPKMQSKKNLVESIKEKSFFESQAIVANAFDIEIKSDPVIRAQSDGSIRLEVTFSKEEWEKLNRMRELLSHSLPNGSWDQTILHVADKVIAAKTKTRSSLEKSFYQKRKNLLKQQTCCQYQDRGAKRSCNSKWQLQVDHIVPRWAGGSDEISNLRVLCGAHNRMIYHDQAGIRFVR